MFKFMHSSVPLSALAVTAAFWLPMAQAQPAPGSMAPHSMQGKAGDAPSKGGTMDMKGMMKGNQDKMSSMQMTGNPDVDFALMMRIHHQGAIDMAEAQIRDGKNSEMKKMAQKIIADQKKEIAQFDKFLTQNGQVPEKMSR